jgi:ATP-binding cassette subfamily B protein
MRIFVKAPLVGIGAIIMAMRLNLRLSTVFIFILPIVFVIIFKVMSKTFPIFTRMQEALDAVNSRMREYLSGVRVVKAFNRFDFENEQFATTNHELADIGTTAMKWSSLMNPGIGLTLNLGLLVILWLGGQFVDTGYAMSGEVIAFSAYMIQIGGALWTLSMVFTMFVRAKASAIRIGDVLNDEDILEQPLTEKYQKIQGQIAFEDVSFSFSNNQTLKNISFTSVAGAQLGIIGATGSGKTTLVNLLMKFYEPNYGTIKIDDWDIKQIPAQQLRKEVAIVPQKTVLFTGTILENLHWGDGNANLEDIRVATKIAQIDEYIMSLSDGYDSRVGQGGVNFSGGQRQRLAIARALIRKPSVLILDDSLSAVDANTEASIKAALANYPQKISMIIIGQKIASVANCDQILVLDHGEVAAIGTHEQLLTNSTIYQEIYESQIGRGVQFGKGGINHES